MNIKTTLAAAIISSAVISMPSVAAENTIKFTGEITGTTCEATVGGSSASTVALQSAPSTAFDISNQNPINYTKFNIVLDNCNRDGAVYARFSPVNGLDKNGTLKVIAAGGTGTAPSGVAVALYDLDGKQLDIGNQDSQGTKPVEANKGVTLEYAAAMVSNGVAASAGSFEANVTYVISYQ